MLDLVDLSESMKNLFLNEEHTDCTIRAQDRRFPVHKAIISARAPALAAMLEDSTADGATTAIEAVAHSDPEVFEQLLLYVYSGRIEGLESMNAIRLYELGEKYNLPNLKRHCVYFLERSLHRGIFFEVFELAWKYDIDVLKTALQSLFSKSATEIILTPKWSSLMRDNPEACSQLFLKYARGRSSSRTMFARILEPILKRRRLR